MSDGNIEIINNFYEPRDKYDRNIVGLAPCVELLEAGIELDIFSSDA